MDLLIAPAAPEDLAGIAAVTVKAWQATFQGILPDAYLAGLTIEAQQQRHQSLFGGCGVVYHVAKVAGEIVGFSSGGPNRAPASDEANELYGLYLLPSWQGQGIGRQLLLAVAMQLQAPGRQGLFAWVLADNPHRHFYQRCGGGEVSTQTIELAGQSWPITGYRWSSAAAADTCVFNPDDYLETLGGRVFSQSRNPEAWRLALLALERALSRARPNARLQLVVGVQASGKSYWIEQNRAATNDTSCLYFDAALPRRVHRAPILALAARHGVPVTAVWVQAPVEQALARNALRRVDHQVPRASIEAVAAAFEPPCRSEGFVEVIEVNASQSGHEKAARL
ncbi:GNAT family N-acetyltransferase [Pseudomonas alloputida]|uniref:GNAT family N-acetyltransferase n=1 Tax=Pseudomonas TaxID=286 RepID=UPI003EEE0367